MAAAKPSQSASGREGCLSGINRAINGTFERIFDALGRFTGRRPVVVLVLSALLFLAIASGIRNLENETSSEKLWVPKDNDSQRNNDFVKETFPSLGRFENVYIERKDGGNILTPAAFDRALQLHNSIIETTWDNLADDGSRDIDYLPQPLKFTDLCLNRNSGEGVPAGEVLSCEMNNPLELFSYDAAAWATPAGLLEGLNSEAGWPAATVGRGFVLEQVLGGIERNAADEVVGARVISLVYFLAGNQTLIEDQKDDEPAMNWEREVLDLLEAEGEADAVYTVARFTTRSFEDEFGSTIDGDLQLLQVAIIGIVVYTYVAISNSRDGFVGSRLALTIGGLLNIGLAVLAAYGFGGYVGLLFTPLMSILPFIMIGIGVDGMFVLQGSLDHTDPSQSMEDRMGYTLRHAGTSVTVASLTNFGAFMIGSNTSLPGLSAFSIYAAIGLLFDLILQVTFFSAIMCIDARRQRRRAVDILCCVESSMPENVGCCCGACKRPRKRPSTKVMGWLGRQYPKAPVRWTVVIVWLVALAAGIYGTSQMRVDADVNNFIPEGSYLRDWIRISQGEFDQTGTEVGLYWVSTPEAPVDFTAAQTQEAMDASLRLFQANEYVLDETVSSWWDAFRDSLNGTVTAGTFYTDLADFLATPAGGRYVGDIVFAEPDTPASGISTARSGFRLRYLEDTTDQVNALKSMRLTEDDIPPPLGNNGFVHSEDFLNFEQYKTIGREAFMNIGLGFLMIAVVVIVLIANPLASLLTFISVASAILELVGFMYFRGTYIDSVTVIFLVISLGLAVDYSVHVAHGYLTNRAEDPVERLQGTMKETGAAVINGAASTLIAALCLSGSGTYVFLTFFYALLFIVLCGAFQGLVVLPVLLDIFKPAAHIDVLPDEGIVKEESEDSSDGDEI
eukprot:jgi/Ulvmu1/8393/UM042_0100.1